MIRLIFPLFFLAFVLWLALFGVPHNTRKSALIVVRQIAVVLFIAAFVLTVVSLAFYILGVVNVG